MTDTITTSDPKTVLRFATVDDVGLILDFIRQLAAYEKKSDEVRLILRHVHADITFDLLARHIEAFSL